MFFIRKLLVLLLCFLPVSDLFALDKQVIGWIEKVKIENTGLQLKAKIDTGATTSSINAKIIKKFKKDGQSWIRFKLIDKQDNKIVFERRVIQYVKIKRKLAFSIKRPVILLGLCIGNVYREEKVNLSDRKNFVYPVLVGRNYLGGYFLVDSAHKFTVKPEC